MVEIIVENYLLLCTTKFPLLFLIIIKYLFLAPVHLFRRCFHFVATVLQNQATQ